jgi:hypothetical protein
VPYAVVMVLGIGIIGVAAWRITAGPGREKLPAVVARRDALAKQSIEEGTS